MIFNRADDSGGSIGSEYVTSAASIVADVRRAVALLIELLSQRFVSLNTRASLLLAAGAVNKTAVVEHCPLRSTDYIRGVVINTTIESRRLARFC